MQETNVDYKGIKYPSQKAMCDAYKVSQTVFCKRMKRGWSLKESLEGKQPIYSQDGVDYFTQKEICDAFDIHPNTMRTKLQNGYTIAEIVARQTFRTTDYLGNKYKNTKEMCDKYGVKVSTFRARIRAGHSIEESLTP